MLNYIVKVTEDLSATVVMVVMIYAFMEMLFRGRGKRSQKIAIAAGILASAVMAVVKNRTSKIATNQWNLYIFYVALIATLAFFVFALICLNSRREQMSFAEGMTHLSAAVLSADLIFYEAPDVMAYPFLFDLGKEGVLSVRFLVRLIGWLLALVLVYVLGLLLYKAIIALNSAGILTLSLFLALLANAVRLFGLILGKWIVKPKWLTWPDFSSKDHPWAFPVAMFVSNHTLLFIILICASAMIIPLVLFARSLRITEPYDNPAQRRKLLAKNRRQRRWSAAILVCMAIAVVNLTAVKAYDNRVVELSPPEEYTVEGDKILIPLENLEDGHLHRYEYTTKDKVDVRWIVIKKPGASSYGVGLDACNVCGIAGYFERSGQVVCKRCDVVMNINTIGFKGGCNPIPLAYRVDGGNMIIELSDVLDGEVEFK